ncbi:hypothetical protein KIK84_08420 [Curvibacter sp. CHRR-16]|uniref:hypothetical protein n=1 Tax=Curvibacter sp. CHRR-16 TaxID=2835872 RepID=UPI001BDA4C8C|nr:hypothetical protein [Curvibacter sp. CHRR-16]MBT0570349.1 hypothetical protein [Curvibacter sp. CHRR-16]
MFLFFSVARSAPIGQAERAEEGPAEIHIGSPLITTDSGEKMPTDKLVDVSPMALRMSSPFNAGYWLSAA